ncbi:hypothetical protein FD754_006836 [Muntiacus muntjak]|uniref:Synaptonemal complex protein 1 n=1 Tax=Muntiacus muntjak TaxID=9888 RepID=A0A5N3WLM5_MUNMU|nr:hypothetical protein FD754_006836 [Muntiacus muntjak]
MNQPWIYMYSPSQSPLPPPSPPDSSGSSQFVDLSLGFLFCSTDLYFCLCASTILNELESVREELKQKGDEVKSKLDKSEENVYRKAFREDYHKNRIVESYKNSLESIEKNVSEDSCLCQKATCLRSGRVACIISCEKYLGLETLTIYVWLDSSGKNDKVDLMKQVENKSKFIEELQQEVCTDSQNQITFFKKTLYIHCKIYHGHSNKQQCKLENSEKIFSKKMKELYSHKYVKPTAAEGKMQDRKIILSKLISIELVMPSNHLILCRLLLLLPSIFLSTRNFSNESSKGLSRVFSNITRVKRQSTELEKYLQIINKSQSLKNKCCMILKISPCAVILEPKKIKSVTISLSWNSAKYLAQLDFHIKYVSKLETELEGAKQKFKQMTDSYQKEIEDKKLLEENLLGEVAKAKVVADEAVKLQKEIDIRCQHKIAEMVALMEKHKHQYDKIVEERDSELGLYKSKEQEHSSVKASLETELSNLRNELWSVKKDLETEREEKKTQTSLLETPETSYWKLDSKVPLSQNASRSFLSADQSRSSKDKRDYLRTPAKNNLSTPLPKAYTVKTPTKLKIQQRGNKNVPIEESNSKKRKMVFEFDINSDSSETTDLLSMVSEEETLRKLYKNNNPPISHLCVRTPKKTPSSLMTPGSMPKSETMRKMQEDRWAVIAKMDRKQKLKEAEKLFV